MDEKANRAAHGLAAEKTGQALKFRVFLNGSEEGGTILDDEIDSGNEGFKTLRSAMALEIESEGSEAHLGEKDGNLVLRYLQNFKHKELGISYFLQFLCMLHFPASVYFSQKERT